MTIRENNVGIIGTGYYVPEKVLTNFDLEKMVDTNDQWIVERTGIKERRIAADNEVTSDLAFAAAENALQDAGVTAEELDLIIVCTLTSDTIIPSTACRLQDRLGAKKAAAFDLVAACSGFVYGLGVATQFIKTGFYKKILVIGADTLSKYTNWKDRNTCILFADGAGAAVLGEVEAGYGIRGLNFGADGSGGDAIIIPSSGSLHPPSIQALSDNLHYIHMNGKDVFKFAIKTMVEATLESLKEAGLTTADIDYMVPHQANLRIIQASAKRLHLPLDKVMVNIDKYGNTSAASVPIALAEAKESGKIKKGDNVVLVGFGAGLTWASCVMKWAKEE